MPCMWCARYGYWECGEVKAELCRGGETIPGYQVKAWEWTYAGEVELEEGETYYVKCRPGCEAVVDGNPDVTPPWILAGTLPESDEEDLVPGWYKIYCRTGGGGQRCWVKLELAGGESG